VTLASRVPQTHAWVEEGGRSAAARAAWRRTSTRRSVAPLASLTAPGADAVLPDGEEHLVARHGAATFWQGRAPGGDDQMLCCFHCSGRTTANGACSRKEGPTRTHQRSRAQPPSSRGSSRRRRNIGRRTTTRREEDLALPDRRPCCYPPPCTPPGGRRASWPPSGGDLNSGAGFQPRRR
jgi:hypothetical protein